MVALEVENVSAKHIVCVDIFLNATIFVCAIQFAICESNTKIPLQKVSAMYCIGIAINLVIY